MSVKADATKWTVDEEENFLSDLSAASFKNRTPVVVYLSMVSIVGFVGNTLVLLVYGFRFKPCATRVFVLFMASLDLVANVLGLPLQIATIRHAYNDNYWRCRSFFAFATLSTQASGVLLVLVALDRFWRICFPLRKQLNARQALKVTLITVCCTVVVFVPFVPFYGIHHVNTTAPGVQARMCWSEDEFKHTAYPLVYKVVVGIMFCGGLVIIGASYICIGKALWRKQVERKRSLRLEEQTASAMGGPGATGGEAADQQPGSTLKGATRVAQLQADRIRCTSETSLSESVTTEDCLTNTDSQNAEPSVKNTPEVPDKDAATGTQSNMTSCELLAVEQRRPRSEHLSQGHRSSSLEPEQKRNTMAEQKKTVARGNVHQCIRRMRSRTTLMMFVLSLFYIFNWLPHFAMRAVRSDPVNLCDNFTQCGYNTYAIVIRSYYLNSAVNAFVYSFCNGQFRQKCREFFLHLRTKIRARIGDGSS